MKRILSDRSQDELIEAATQLADQDLRLLWALIDARRSAGLSQQDVAELIGIKQSSVAAFERYDNDPRLSTIRRYAIAIGASISHRVAPQERWDWEHVPSQQPEMRPVVRSDPGSVLQPAGGYQVVASATRAANTSSTDLALAA